MKRPYRQVKRAEAAQATRGRILEAAEGLWREAGPRGTAVAEVARRAGVDRITVYNHFPSDADLAAAVWDGVVARWPRPGPGAAEEDPEERLRIVLAAVWGWYDGVGRWLGPVLRDGPAMPALGPILGELEGSLAAAVAALEPGRRRTAALAPTLRVALAFPTWEALRPLPREAALDLAEGWVRAAEGD